jgi:drug/metabolite transporter (DMT)-like permease
MNIALYVVVVMVWGTSWFAITFQVAAMPADLSVLYRFALAAVLMVTWAAARGDRLRFSARQHGLIALLGLLMFSTNYLLFYGATAAGMTTGLVAIVFSTAVIMNLINERIWFGRRADVRVVAAAGLGVLGIAIVFWRDLQELDLSEPRSLAVLLCVAGTYFFSLGNMVSARLQGDRLPVVSTTGFAMAYGVVATTIFALAVGTPFGFDLSFDYVASLVFLAVLSSVVGFASYLTLLGRIGASRASYATVLFPLIALGVSTLFEGYRWTGLAMVGVVMILAGNVVVLVRSRRPRPVGRVAV